jgi:uncharacterized membrane protein YkvA (DUF1232 family)
MVLRIVLGMVGGVLLLWLALVVVLLVARPRGTSLREVVRLLPDLLRLVGRLTADRSLPRGVRLKLGLLAGYLAMPFDLVPDFVPVLGYADDAIAVAWTLRSVTRQVGLPAVRRHWPGTDDGFAALARLCRLAGDPPADVPADPKGDPPAGRLSWWVDFALLAGFAALTLVLAGGWLLGLDVAVRDWCDSWRGRLPGTYWPARVLNMLGQGSVLTVVSVGLALVLARRARSWWPLAPVVAAYALTTLTLGALKLGLDRAPPHATTPHPERLFSGGMSYPGGHLANTIVWYGVIVLLLSVLLHDGLAPSWRLVLRVVPPIVVGLANTYLGFHWLTDNLASIPLALLIDRIMRRVPWKFGGP